ncbi:MAG: SpoIIIAH-like family protein [Oscillospiraceae bacterium]|jgi:stage III sporulation protein AH
MKLNMIVGKKQIVLASLILVLGVAVYINWTFANDENNIAANAGVSDSSTSDGTSSDADKNYGDASLVSNTADNSDDFFAKARLEKQTSRDEAVATLAKMFGDTSASSEQVKEATDKALATAQMIESESKMETLIKSKGFADCVVYLSDQNAKVVVKTDGLDEAGAAQIMDIVVSEAQVPNENVSIVEVQ